MRLKQIDRKTLPLLAFPLALAACMEGSADASIKDFSLINAETNQPVAGYNPIPSGAVLNLAALPSRKLSIRANLQTGTKVGSIQMVFNGSQIIENTAPYTLCRDDGTYYYDCAFKTGSYTLAGTAYTKANMGGRKINSYSIPFTIVDQAASGPQVTAFALIDSTTDKPVPGYENLRDGQVINFNVIGTRTLSVRAITNPEPVGAVMMEINTTQTSQTVAPYSLCNDSGGDYYDCGFTVGTYTVATTPYANSNMTGAGARKAIQISFVNTALPAPSPTPTATATVVPSPSPSPKPSPSPSPTATATPTPTPTATTAPAVSVSSFTLMNTSTNQPVAGFDPIPNGATINVAAIGTNTLSVRVNTAPATVGSVKMELDSTSRHENLAPYALCNDGSGWFWDCGFTYGTHTVAATPYTGANLTGTAGARKQIQFTIVNQASVPSPTPTATVAPTPTATATPIPSPTVTATATPTPTATATPTPTVTPTPTPTATATTSPTGPVAVSGNLSAVWANDGGDKVTRDERRGSNSPSSTMNRTWDGSKVSVFGGKNEVVGFNMVLESKANAATGAMTVTFNRLTGPGGFTISSAPTSGDGVFDWTKRQIELFYVRYLKIEGLSLLSYETYDERHIPKRFQRPYTGEGVGSGTWANRPDHDKYYPEIAVPMETKGTFTIAANQNQSVWADVFIPKTAPAGTYTGTVEIREGATVVANVPVELTVRDFTLPDVPTSKTMVNVGYSDINNRYLNVTWPNSGTPEANATKLIRDRHFMVAHRHKIALIDSNDGPDVWTQDAPRPEWLPRLNGSLFTAAKGYDGPGINTGNGIYSIGTYSTWNWKSGGESAMRTRTDAWENWFRANASSTERFLYLVDESTNYAQTEQWASWAKNNPGVGRNLPTFATLGLPEAVSHVPSLNIAASWMSVGAYSAWENALQTILGSGNKKAYMYNGKRPASGTFATEDDGVALRQLAWGQHKKGIDRWFFWESTYYNDFQGGRGQTNVFQTAQTFGGSSGVDPIKGKTGWNASNGDGVLFYPGTDKYFPSDSYGLNGPIASLRMKHWRRGIQDVDYIAMASAINPTKVNDIVNRMVPKFLWDYGVSDANDPTWVRSNISWSTNPDDWEAARAELAAIIEAGR